MALAPRSPHATGCDRQQPRRRDGLREARPVGAVLCVQSRAVRELLPTVRAGQVGNDPEPGIGGGIFRLAPYVNHGAHGAHGENCF